MDVSDTTWSWPPRSQVTGGLRASPANADVLYHFGEMALKIPRFPGATPGQFGEAVASPGLKSSPVRVRSTSSSRNSSSTCAAFPRAPKNCRMRSEEHTSELQSQ